MVPGHDGDTTLVAADSWLVQDGAVRGLGLHRSRFTSACAGTGAIELSEIDKFWPAVVDQLPRRGAWFPRVELVRTPNGYQLRLRIRQAPARTGEVKVWIGRGDPRQTPRRKGPDLAMLGELHAEAMRFGADEALLTTPSGLVLEGSRCGLVWWEGNTLCVPDGHLRVLPSVTVTLIRRAALGQGIAIAGRRRRLAELADREVWMVNALHGIRPVTGWIGGPRAGAAVRAPCWQRWWAGAAVALPSHDVFARPA
ncbi:aminotransferase class IV [Kibdelosporangium phytohabitans]|uniref:Aminotransferase class IV n=2 Tax=Kibdelosporangium phytohabitans TaxID=860235 RepID=A0A0N9I934_9PSEU|nr:aminotransferase class IV [Kibdelosporangium phytohabitans]